MALTDLRKALKALGNPDKAMGVARFFKTGPGEYGEGDVFLGVSVPQQRKLARQYGDLSLKDVETLLKSPLHEERLTALFILVRHAEKGRLDECLDLYLRHTKRVNNWDLVDSSAAQIVGAHGDRALLRKLAKSKLLWERRIAMVATYAFTRKGDPGPAFEIALMVADDEEDLMHKAAGWMLREVGKHVDEDVLRGFLEKHYARLPRTALRYAIERFPASERKAWITKPR